jgi:hypothetical protein
LITNVATKFGNCQSTLRIVLKGLTGNTFEMHHILTQGIQFALTKSVLVHPITAAFVMLGAGNDPPWDWYDMKLTLNCAELGF